MIKIDRILSRMSELGLNPFSAAKNAGLGRDYVRDLIRGKVRHPSPGKLRELAAALQCSTEYLTGETDDIGSPPELFFFDERPRPVNLKIESIIRSGFFSAHQPPTLEKEVFHWVISAGYEVPEWLEIAGDSQIGGEIPANSLVHLIEPSQFWAGLTDLVVVEESRGEGAFRLVERSIRRIRFNNRGIVYFEPGATYGGRWEHLVSDNGIEHEIGGPSEFEEGSEGRLPIKIRLRIAALVVRAYRFFDNGLGVGIPF